MTRLLILASALAAAFVLSVPLTAQPVGQPQGITVVDSGTACVTAPTACAFFTLDSTTAGLTLGISGTWTGTLTFEGTNDNDVWTAVIAKNLATGAEATTTTASGLFTITNSGMIRVRARATAAITGVAVVKAAKGLGFARLFGPSPTFTQAKVGDGSAAAPSYTFANGSTSGLYLDASGNPASSTQGAIQWLQAVNGFTFASTVLAGWSSSTPDAAAADTTLARVSAGVAKLAHGTAASTAEWQVSGGNGGFISAVKALTELTTIAAAATTSTAIQIPANAVVLGVSVRVVTVIPTAATFTVTSATPTKTWNTVAVAVAAGTTNPGTLPGPTFQTTASAITITPNLTPGAATGQVRVTIYYYTITPPST